MPAWQTPTVHATGDIFAVNDNNILANNETFLYQAPYASYYNNAVCSVANVTNTQVTLTGLTFSNYGASITSNAIAVPLTGIYQIHFRVGFASASSGGGYSWVTQNGTQAIVGSDSTFATAGGRHSNGSGLLSCNSGDLVALWCYQSSGGTINTVVGQAWTALEIAFRGSV